MSLHGSKEVIFIRVNSAMQKIIERTVCNEHSVGPSRGNQSVTGAVPHPKQPPSTVQNAIKSKGCKVRMLYMQGCFHSFLEAYEMRLEFRRACQRTDVFQNDAKIVAVAASQHVTNNASL